MDEQERVTTDRRDDSGERAERSASQVIVGLGAPGDPRRKSHRRKVDREVAEGSAAAGQEGGG